MSKTPGSAAQIRPGLLDRLKAQAGIKSDEAFARLLGTTRQTVSRLKDGEEPSIKTAVRIAQTFGLGLGEVVEMLSPTEPAETQALAKAA